NKQTEFALKVGNGIAKSVLGAISDPRKAIFAVAENVLDVAVEGAVLAMDGGKLGEVVTTFARHRDRLLDGYDSELKEVAALLERAGGGYLAWQPKLFEPMPPSANLDVRGPDFRYENFSSKTMSADQFNPAVDRERQKFAAEEHHNLVNPD